MHETLRGLGERVAALTDALQARREPAASTIGTDHDTHAALKQIGSALEGQAGALDQAMRAHVKSLELGVARLVDDAGRGRDRAVDEIRTEIRLLARTISALADRERWPTPRASPLLPGPDARPGYVDAHDLLLTITFL